MIRTAIQPKVKTINGTVTQNAFPPSRCGGEIWLAATTS
jgi:hypothetical protein